MFFQSLRLIHIAPISFLVKIKYVNLSLKKNMLKYRFIIRFYRLVTTTTLDPLEIFPIHVAPKLSYS